MNKQIDIIAFCLVATVYWTAVLLGGCVNPSGPRETLESRSNAPAKFVGSNTCQSCHPREFADWIKSDHYLAMQPANDTTIQGDFDNASFKADGVSNKFFKRDGQFFINTQGDDGKNHDFPVLYAFGYFPLQQYLISFPGGRIQATRVSWDSRDKKWFHQYAGQKIYHHDWIHWTGNGQNWNTMCASCHSTNLQKNYDFSKDSYNTTWNEVNVACETCHGAGSKHVGFVQSPEFKNGERLNNSGLVYAKNANPQIQINTCAPCHARKSDLSKDVLLSAELLDDLVPQVISNEYYFADGQIREEDYEYGSFTQSKMFHNNIRCSNCHNPHSGKLQLSLADNALCMSCHKPKYNTEEHHFHKIKTEGAQCVSCHMPAKTFMGIDHRRDHSFRVPRPDQSVDYGTPNTCTGCHQNKSAVWASDAIKNWYGPNRAYHFSDDLLPGSQFTAKSEGHLIKLLADTLQPEIARATAAYYLGSVQSPGSAGALVRSLQDRMAQVRYQSLRSLENFSPEIWRQAAFSCLTDKVRAVRIAAADLYHRLPKESIPAAVQGAYIAADAENQKFLKYQTDFAVGNVMQADYAMQGGDNLNAIVHYVRGLRKDSLMNYARLNLSAAYNSVGKNSEALKTLKDAAAIDPGNARIFYNLGLLYYELQDVPSAIGYFQKAVHLRSEDPGLYYNYGLILQQQGKMKESEQVLMQGFSLDPGAAKINYALAYLYMSQHQPEKARKHAEVLRKIDPNNPEYQGLFRNLGM